MMTGLAIDLGSSARGMRPGGGSSPWWNLGDSSCVGAWQAVGAASYAASLLDLSGSNNLSEGTAPSWDAAGWTFDGSNDQLVIASPLGMPHPLTIIVAAARIGATGGAFAKVGNGFTGIGIGMGGTRFENDGINILGIHEGWAWVDTGAEMTTEGVRYVLSVSTNAAKNQSLWYADGSHVHTENTGMNEATTITYIGGYVSGNPRFASAIISSAAIYNRDLTAEEIATVSAAMAAL